MAGVVCRVCDLENAEGARFCSACGAALQAEKGGDALVGTQIAGKFRVEKLLGNGAMGRVYKATHIALDRGVAIKVMHDHLARSSDFAIRFVREARAASKLDHPNSIRVLDFGRTDANEGNLLYLVMELFIGPDLYGLLRDEGPLDLERGGRIVAQILAALEDAHAIGLVHRDIKPENVLVGKKGDGSEIAKICDFGIAKVARDEGPKLSQAGNMIGTPLYMSPEAAMGRDCDARADLYSVGIVLYEVVTGTRPFDAPSPLEVARMQVEEPPQPPSQRTPERNVPPALERVILKSIAKRPEDRWQTAREFREALESALGASNTQAQAIATLLCKACGTQVPQTSRFCPSCGAVLQGGAAQRRAPATTKNESSFAGLSGMLPDRLLGDLRRAASEVASERRTLAALALDLIGSDDAGDPEELAGRIGDRYELVSRVLQGHQAYVQGAGGTRVTALFGIDAAADESETLVAKAVEAAFAVKREAGGAKWFKGAIASGVFLVTPGPNGPTALGAAAQTAGRNAELARAGEIVVDESIRGRVGEGFTTTPSRGGLHLVREDFAQQIVSPSMRPFVGREAELEAFGLAAREAFEHGRGQVVAIRGEAGMGKTALIREATNRVRDLDIRWLRVACRPTGAQQLGAFRDLVLVYTGIGRGATPDVVKQSLAGERGSLAGLGLGAADQQHLVGMLVGNALRAGSSGGSVPPGGASGLRSVTGAREALGSGAREVPGTATRAGTGMRAAVTQARAALGSVPGDVPPEVVAREGGAAIRNFLNAALRKGDIGIIVEDIQWIDPASATLLAQLAATIAKRPSMLVLSARAGIWSDWNAPHFKRIQLGPLGAEPASRLLQSMLPDAEVPPAVAQPILQRAGGNPLFLESIVEALRASGGVRVEAGRYLLAEGAKLVAEGLRGLVEARLRALDGDAQRTLLLASVAGNEVELSDLQALAGVDVDVETAVRTLLERGILEERARTEAGARRVGVANDGVRDVLYDTIPLAERKELHAALAERWEAIRAATKTDPVPLEELARHWELAGEVGPAVARLQDAAAELLARGEAKAAAGLLRRAAANLAALDPLSGARLVMLLADALSQFGDVQAVDQTIAMLGSVAIDPAHRPQLEAQADRLRGAANRRAGRPQIAAQHLQRALDRALEARDADLASDLYLDLTTALEEANETQKALATALTGLEMASKLAENTSRGTTIGASEGVLRLRLANLLNAIGRLYLRRDDAVRAADYFRGSLAQAEKIRDAAAAARALANLAHIAARRDDFRAASAESSRALRLAQEAGDRMAQARIQVNLGHYLARLGRLVEAEESYRAAQTLAEAIGWNEGVAVAHQALEAVARAG
ncbi:MAG: protein kinase [Deltaproteobacteria bacterium]|nr:protein kinase [Deltaproteobacteria bacterium]